MDAQKAAKVIRRVRRRLGLSQEGLAHLLNATKGAVQHWERGRNKPDLARLLALCRLCASGPERKELEALVRQAQEEVTAVVGERLDRGAAEGRRAAAAGRVVSARGQTSIGLLRRKNSRLERHVARLRGMLQRRNEQLRILEDLAADLQRQIAELRASRDGNAQGSRSLSPPNLG